MGIAGPLAAAGLLVLGLVMANEIVLRHDLLTAHFDGTAAPFETGEMPQYTATLSDGGYRMTATTAPESPVFSFAMFTRPAYDVTIDVVVVELDDPSGDAAVGVECLDLPETNGHGYAFVVSADSMALVRTDGSGERAAVLTETPLGNRWPLDGRHIGIACGSNGDEVAVAGTIDGTTVLTATDRNGFTRYQAMSLLFMPFDDGDTVVIDDVIARVPGG